MDAGFHADQAGSPALEECQHPAAPELTAHHGTFFLTAEIRAEARHKEAAQRLQTMPGVPSAGGPLA